MGYKADYKVSHLGLDRGLEVVATFDVSGRTSENADLKEYVAESAV